MIWTYSLLHPETNDQSDIQNFEPKTRKTVILMEGKSELNQNYFFTVSKVNRNYFSSIELNYKKKYQKIIKIFKKSKQFKHFN